MASKITALGLIIDENLVPTTKYSIKCPSTRRPTRIIIHNTYNDASADNEIAYMIKNDKEASFNYAVDDIHAVKGVYESRVTWNAGDGRTGIGNLEGISIEICYSKSGGNRFINAEKNAVKLVVDILTRYGWSINKVTKHQDYSGKYCPHRTLDMGWDRFLGMVKDAMNPPIPETTPDPIPTTPDVTPGPTQEPPTPPITPTEPVTPPITPPAETDTPEEATKPKTLLEIIVQFFTDLILKLIGKKSG